MNKDICQGTERGHVPQFGHRDSRDFKFVVGSSCEPALQVERALFAPDFITTLDYPKAPDWQAPARIETFHKA